MCIQSGLRNMKILHKRDCHQLVEMACALAQSTSRLNHQQRLSRRLVAQASAQSMERDDCDLRLPARVMSDLPRWHTQRGCGRCQNSRYFWPETRTTSSMRTTYLFGQNMTEYNPAPPPSGHPLLSGPPTLTDIHQIFTRRWPPAPHSPAKVYRRRHIARGVPLGMQPP